MSGVAIDVIDWRGDHWALIFMRYNSARTEAWMYAVGGAPFPNYDRIPVPLFSEWWPHETA